MKIIHILKANKLLAAVFLAYLFLFAVMPEKALLSVKNSMYYVIEMIEVMPVIFVLTAIIEAWVPRQVIISGFGEKSGIRGNIFSFVLGSLSAGPIYAAFPVCKMLLNKGVGMANIVIILSSWAVIKIPMLANEAKFLGVRFMEIRWILTVISIVIMAYIVSVFVKKQSVPVNQEIEYEDIIGIEIKEQYCIGCGLCATLLPECFEMNNKKAQWKMASIDKEQRAKFEEIIDKCPAKVIGFN